MLTVIRLELIIVIRDITQRKRMEMELKESDEFHRQLMSNLSMGVVIIDPLTRIIENVNDAAAAMFGALKGKIIGNRCHSFLCPAQEGHCPVCDLGKEVDNSEKTLLCADGGKRSIIKTVKKTNVKGQQKLLECFVDITEQKRDEEALRASDSRFRALFESFGDTMWVIDPETGSIIDANPAATRMYGFTRDELLSPRPHQDLRRPGEYVGPPSETGPEVIFPSVITDARMDRSFPVEITSNTFQVDGQTLIIGTVRDITEQIDAQKEIEESEAKYRGLFDNMQEMVAFLRLIRDERGDVIDASLIDANMAALRTLRKTSLDEVRGKTMDALLCPDSASRLRDNILNDDTDRKTGQR